MTDEFLQWLRAQLDYDEQIARAASAPDIQGQDPQPSWAARHYPTGDTGGPRQATVTARGTLVASELNPWNIDVAMARVVHMAEHDPARVLAEVEAKRGVLRQYDELREQVRHPVSAESRARARALQGEIGDVLCLLALPYADRPGYLDEWRPHTS
ncbi:DUF6221 family protein [Streptomyces sp. NPDC006458]|uniref:DUF6221 family protein n=1 Tax=Streptomyces sp. NPDC006458 TaxID=3154302 RepID=UPI0033BDE3AA